MIVIRGFVVALLLGMTCAFAFASFICVHIHGDDEGDLCALACRGGGRKWGVEDGGYGRGGYGEAEQVLEAGGHVSGAVAAANFSMQVSSKAKEDVLVFCSWL